MTEREEFENVVKAESPSQDFSLCHECGPAHYHSGNTERMWHLWQASRSRLTSGLRELAENIEWIRTHGLERISQTRDLKELNVFHQGRADAAESMQAFWRDYEKTHGALLPEATKLHSVPTVAVVEGGDSGETCAKCGAAMVWKAYDENHKRPVCKSCGLGEATKEKANG